MKTAERVDSFRVFPRAVLILYMLAIGHTLSWYLDFDIKYQTKCDEKTLIALLDRDIGFEDAKREACTIVTAVGRPSGYTTLVSVMIGAGAGVFGFYVNSGNIGTRKEEK
jgi:hypothetical protein